MTRQLLMVVSAGVEYALEASYVREIAAMLPTTRLPGAGPEVLGLVNLRGHLFPVIDLSVRLGGEGSGGRGIVGEVVVLAVEGKHFGVLVDEVREVIPVEAPEVEGSELLRGQGPGGLIREVGHFREAVVLEVDVRALAAQSLA